MTALLVFLCSIADHFKKLVVVLDAAFPGGEWNISPSGEDGLRKRICICDCVHLCKPPIQQRDFRTIQKSDILLTKSLVQLRGV